MPSSEQRFYKEWRGTIPAAKKKIHRKLKEQLAIWYAKQNSGKKRAKKPKTKSSGGTAPLPLLQRRIQMRIDAAVSLQPTSQDV